MIIPKQKGTSMIRLFFAALLCSAVLQAAIPTSVGWHEMPNTMLNAVAPPNNYSGTTYPFNFASYSVTDAWSGGAFDYKRNRLLIWGGGHGDYVGNEIYALDLNTEKMLRLTDPALPYADPTKSPAMEELAPNNGTQPNGRHTYDGLCYMPNYDVMWAFGGSLTSGDGGGSSWTWIFDPATLKWKHVVPKGANPGTNAYLGVISAYDSSTGAIYLHQRNGFYKYVYDASGGTYTQLSGYNTPQLNFSMNGVFDPKRKLFLVMGNGDQHLFNMNAGGGYQVFNSTGAPSLVAHQGPGLAYDPVTDRIVGWATGDTVYTLNMDTRVWTAQAYAGGPYGCSRGTYGRFEYVPALDAFVTYHTKTRDGYNAPEANAYVLRTRTGAGTEARPFSVRSEAEIFPNPFSGSVSFRFNGKAGLAGVDILSMDGRLIQHLKTDASGSAISARWSAGNHAPGFYLAHISTGYDILVRKVLRMGE
jgi:hypothetical protein